MDGVNIFNNYGLKEGLSVVEILVVAKVHDGQKGLCPASIWSVVAGGGSGNPLNPTFRQLPVRAVNELLTIMVAVVTLYT